MAQKTIGILGGMGPAATAELFTRIINNTAAEMDQEHVSMIIINDPQIPDRSAYILEDGISPIPRLQENLNKLYYAGADVAVMPCMTAHSFINELNENSPIPVINAIEVVDQHMRRYYSNLKKIGLLATNGSIATNVFQKYMNTKIIIPNSVEQQEVMEIIYSIKSGDINNDIINRLKKLTKKLREENAEAIIAGCTELSLIMNEEELHIPVIDPITILAKKVVDIGNNYAIKLN